MASELWLFDMEAEWVCRARPGVFAGLVAVAVALHPGRVAPSGHPQIPPGASPKTPLKMISGGAGRAAPARPARRCPGTGGVTS